MDFAAYPNPASDKASFAFTLEENSNVSLSIYNTLGERIKEVATGNYVKGAHQVECSVEDIPAGVYYYSLEAEGKRKMEKLVVAH